MWTKNYTIQTIKQHLNQQTINNITKQYKDNTQQWLHAGINIGKQNKLPPIHYKSLAGKLASFSTGQLISTNTEKDIREGAIDELIFKQYTTIKQENNKEETQFKKLINYIIQFYIEGKSTDYELATHRINGNVPKSDMENFQKIPGTNKKEKIHNMIKAYDPLLPITEFGSRNVDERIDCYLTPTDYEIFKNDVKGETVKEKIHSLIFSYIQTIQP